MDPKYQTNSSHVLVHTTHRTNSAISDSSNQMGHLSQVHVIIAHKAKMIAQCEGVVSLNVQHAALDPNEKVT